MRVTEWLSTREERARKTKKGSADDLDSGLINGLDDGPKDCDYQFTHICTFVGQDNVLIPSGYLGQRLEYLGQIPNGGLMGARNTLQR